MFEKSISIYSAKHSTMMPITPPHSQVHSNQFLGFEQRTKRKVLTYRGMPSQNKSPLHNQYQHIHNPYQDSGTICFTVRNKDSTTIRESISEPEYK